MLQIYSVGKINTPFFNTRNSIGSDSFRKFQFVVQSENMNLNVLKCTGDTEDSEIVIPFIANERYCIVIFTICFVNYLQIHLHFYAAGQKIM